MGPSAIRPIRPIRPIMRIAAAATCPVVWDRAKVPAMIYLDHNATKPALPEVFEAMRPCFCQK